MKMKSLSLVSCLFFAFLACSSCAELIFPSGPPRPQNDPYRSFDNTPGSTESSIYQELQRQSRWSTLKRGVDSVPGLKDILSDPAKKLTILAPTDKAWNALFAKEGVSVDTAFNDPETTKDHLIGHMLAMPFDIGVLEDLINQMEAKKLVMPSLFGTELTFYSEPVNGGSALKVCSSKNCAMVVSPSDVDAGASRIHSIDAVILADGMERVTMMPNGQTNQNIMMYSSIYDALINEPNFSIAKDAYERLGLLDSLKDPALEITMLLPTNEVFNEVLLNFGGDIHQMLRESSILKSIVLTHVFDGAATMSDLNRLVLQAPNKQFKVESVSGQELVFKQVMQDGTKMLEVSATTNATVVPKMSNIAAGPGSVIHAVDSLLIPKEQYMRDLEEVLLNNPRLKTAATILKAVGILDVFQHPNKAYTLLLPEEEAFADFVQSLGMSEQDLLMNRDLLLPVILSHIFPGSVKSPEIIRAVAAAEKQGQALVIKALSGQKIMVTLERNGSGKVDALLVSTPHSRARISMVDMQIGDHIVHTLDHVLVPDDDLKPDVYDVLKSRKEFSIVAKAIEVAGLKDFLRDAQHRLTFLAPSNRAFQMHLNTMGVTLEQVLSDPIMLKKILLTHVFENPANVNDLVSNILHSNNRFGTDFVVKTLSGEDLHLMLVQTEDMGDKHFMVMIQTPNGGASIVEGIDIKSGLSLIHTIDRVLVPSDRILNQSDIAITKPLSASINTPYDIIKADPNLDITYRAIKAFPELKDILKKNMGPRTFFLPTNDAWNGFVSQTARYNSVDQLLEDKDVVKMILTSHIVNSKVKESELRMKIADKRIKEMENFTAIAASGQVLTFTLLSNGKIHVAASTAGDIMGSDISTDNIALYKIDQVLIPGKVVTKLLQGGRRAR